MEVKIAQSDQTGKLEIDALDLFELLSVEQQEILLQDNARNSIVWEEVERIVATDVSSRNYNSDIHRVRQNIIANHMGEILRRWLEGMLYQFQIEQRKAEHYSRSYWTLYHAIPSEVKLRMDLPAMESGPMPVRLSQNQIMSMVEEIMDKAFNEPELLSKEVEDAHV